MLNFSISEKAPIAKKENTALEAHGHERVDPYFWMRLSDEQKTAQQPDQQTQEVVDYLNAENAYTSEVLRGTKTLQENLYKEIVGRIKKTDESVPYFKNGYWYYTRYEEGSEYPIYCRKKQSLENDEKILLNVNELAKEHEYYNVAGLAISPDNKILAYAEDTVSRRIYTYRFKNLETGELYDDKLENLNPGGAWANDNKTFFYTAKNSVSLLSERILRHTLCSAQSEDEVVYHEKDTSFYIGVHRSKSGKYIIIYNSSTIVSDYHILPTDDPNGVFKQFTSRTSKHEYNIYHSQDKWYIITNDNALNFRLMQCEEGQTDISNWKEVIAHREDVLLTDLDVFEKYLVVSETSNANPHLRVMSLESQEEHYIKFEDEAYVAYTVSNPEYNTEELRYMYSSLTTPRATIDYNLSTRCREIKKQQEVIGGHDPKDYVTKRVWATAQDGTKVPMSIVYHKNTKKSGSTPLLQYAYGSYGNSMDPWFSSVRLSLIDRGFIYCIAHIRGGQEMGRSWYDDGKMFNKKNTFTDFIDCSKWLINQGYTSADHLYAMGGSAGGLLMGAIINMAPELYRGVIAAVPFVDVVSTMMDETIPLTTNEFNEWGNPKNKDSYDYMLSYSPYDQVAEQDYPNLLITTGYFDSQVQYWEPAKWIAKLRDKKTDNNLLLMHTNMEAGHGGASGRFKRYKETALEYAFLLGLER